jgi:hypothetical protein
MLQPGNYLRLDTAVGIPGHFDEFAEVSTTHLRDAHSHGMERDLASVRVSTDTEAARLYIESQHPQRVDRELLAVHLARSGEWLMVSFQQALAAQESGGLSYPLSTVVIEQSGTRVHHTGHGGRLAEARLDDNEIAGKYFTGRLYRSLGYFGLYSDEQLEQFRTAS